jgi:hypothetical protein
MVKQSKAIINMTIQTRVCRGQNTTTEEKAAIVVETDRLIALGVTDGNLTRENDDDPDTRVVIRIWTTTEAANNWIAFINTFDPPPVSAVVVEV